MRMLAADIRIGSHHLREGGAVAFIVDWVQHTLPAEIVPTPPEVTAWFEPARKLDEVYVYVDGGIGSFEDRVRLLHQVFGPVQTRGASTEDGHHEDHFATARNWRASYSEWPQGRLIRIAFPPIEQSAARAIITDVLPRLGHTLRHAQTARGARVWAD